MASGVFGSGFLSQGAKSLPKPDAQGMIDVTGLTGDQLARAQAANVAALNAQTPGGDYWGQFGKGLTALQNGTADPNTYIGQEQIKKTAVMDAEYNQGVPQSNPANDRYGSDLSWLDPSFQERTALLGQSAGSQVYANPNAVAAQTSAMNRFGQLADTPLQFQSPAQQQAAYNQWGSIAGGAGAPQFMGNSGQQAVSNQIAGLAGPQWGSDSQQQQVYNGVDQLKNPQWEGSQRQDGVFSAIGGMQGPQFGSASDQTSIMRDMQARATGGGGPQFASDQQAQDQYDALRYRSKGYGAPEFMDGSQQQGVANQLGSIAKSGGAQGLQLDNGANQAEQLGNMREIIAGGGNTAIEAAARQTQRADQEQWLRSQREAQQQQYAQRGMTGSGQELLTLGADRQAAAGRNSLADLQTASALEQRRDQTINSASALSGQMRDQTNTAEFAKAQRGDQALTNQGSMLNTMRSQDFQGKSYLDSTQLDATKAAASQANQLRSQDFQNQSYLDQARIQSRADAGGMANNLRNDAYNEGMGRTNTQLQQLQMQMQIANQQRSDTYNEQSFDAQNGLNKLNTQGNMANAMRQNTYQEQAFGAQNSLAKLQTQADLATQMRQGTYNELSYNDTRATNALQQQSQLANQLRADQYTEQIGGRNAQIAAVQGYGTQANNLRISDAQEAQYRATAADQFSKLNQDALNSAAHSNAQFLQDSYGQMQGNRLTWETNKLNTGVGVATTQKQFAQNDGQFSYGAGVNRSNTIADTFNGGQANYNNTVGGQGVTSTNASSQAGINATNAIGGGVGAIGDAAITAGTYVLDAYAPGAGAATRKATG